MRLLLVLPVYNEAEILPVTVEKVLNTLSRDKKMKGVKVDILIADNGSTDTTPQVANDLVGRFSGVHYLRTENKGRGFALQEAWALEGYDVYSYVDADLAYDLSVVGDIVDSFRGGEQIVVASRLVRGSVVRRHWLRRLLTRGYNLLLKFLFRNKFSDAQSGCKAISRSARDALLPHVKEGGWFFDTLLLILAERKGYRVHSLRIVCIDPRKWRLGVVCTVAYFLYKTCRLRLTLWFSF